MKRKNRRFSQSSALSPRYFLITAFGKDRPGMVAQVTRLVYQSKGNIEDASMTRLGGEFSMMLVVSFPNAAAGKRLIKTRNQTGGLALEAKPIPAGAARSKQPSATHLISIYGIDRPGIVYHAAEALARLRINITDLNTRFRQRSGKSLYLMLLEAQIPSRARAAALKRTLDRLGRALKLQVTLQEIDPVTL